MLYLYASKLTLTKTRLTDKDFLHFVPFLLFLLILILIPGEKEILAKILGGTSAFLGMSYCIVCFILLRNHRQSIENKFSYIDKINLVWINRLVISLLIIWTGVIILVTLNKLLDIKIPLNWFFTMIPLFIFYIGYFGIKQQAIYYTHVKEQNIDINTDIRKTNKSYDNSYVKSGQLPDTMKAIHNRLLLCMQKDKLYLNPTLSLSDLSDEIKLPSHHITQTLNEYAKINFYDFVNEFRVEEFKRKIKSGEAQEFSLLGIAFDCGFNSKSSFNRIFKKFTAQSPSEYNIRCTVKNLNR
jgi:AraC-like DNA-binding protein